MNVKRVEAIGLLAELKGFAFERSPSFRDNLVSGYEETRSFYFPDPVPRDLRHIMPQEVSKLVLSFGAFRVHPARNKPSYTYTLSATNERTLPDLPSHMRQVLSGETLAAYDNFDDLAEAALTEKTSVEIDASDHIPGEITTNHIYEMTYAGDVIHRLTEEDILFYNNGVSVTVPSVETVDNITKHFIGERIPHEAINGVDNVITGLGFQAIAESFEDMEGIDSFRTGATRLRAIMQTLRTGIVETPFTQSA